jgi:hypothetical protein
MIQKSVVLSLQLATAFLASPTLVSTRNNTETVLELIGSDISHIFVLFFSAPKDRTPPRRRRSHDLASFSLHESSK